ncbi:MAG: hypothetical protein R2911_27150 [Caldilineaceae bacterium]
MLRSMKRTSAIISGSSVTWRWISGLRARGDFIVDIEWRNGRLYRANITSDSGNSLALHEAERYQIVQTNDRYVVEFA